ncbi:MAG: glycine zipper domain-containing protein [Planctomycetota bacterium]|jgi:hypothetical protein
MESTIKTRRNCSITAVLTVCICATIITIGGCETRAQTGGLVGAGIGALAGQAIGGNTSSTLIGTAVGAGAGYIIGNEQDKKAAKKYDYNQRTPLTGTKWRVVSLVMEDKPLYESMIVEFKPNGEMVTTEHEPGGTKTITEERYRIVGNTLIISKPGYMINATYKISGNELIVDCREFRAVLQRV